MRLILIAFAAGVALAQSVVPLPSFEVLSVKPSTGFGGQAGDERDKGWGEVTGRVNLKYIPLKYVLLHAYGLRPYQFVGPYWMDTQSFDILANVPAGAPKEQIPLMFQSMLLDRFGLKCHKEIRATPVYALVVAEGGAKLEKPLSQNAQANGWETGPPKVTNQGGKKVLSGVRSTPWGITKVTVSPDTRVEFASLTMDGLAEYLSQDVVDLPVVNMTGLKGSHKVILTIAFQDLPSQRGRVRTDNGAAPDQTVPSFSDPSGPTVRDSLRKMGLRLVSRRVPIETFVVDHINRLPAGN